MAIFLHVKEWILYHIYELFVHARDIVFIGWYLWLGYVGLVNQAMTCYLNSLLQTLYMTPEFRNAIYRFVWFYVVFTTDAHRQLYRQIWILLTSCVLADLYWLFVGLLRPPIHFDRLTVIIKTGSLVNHNHRHLHCDCCYCTTGFFVCRSFFTHCSRPKCSNCSCPSHPLISITLCSQATFDTCQELTSRLHASQWKRQCHRLGRLMSSDVETTHCRPTVRHVFSL